MSTLSEFVSQNKRDDNYVNATEWCRKFGKEFADFKKTQQCKNLAKHLAKNLNLTIHQVLEVNRGKGSSSWVHPVIAIALAEWLDPEFSLLVKNTFIRYLKGDVTLATEIVERTNNVEALKHHKARVDGKIARIGLTNTLQEHGVSQPWQFAQCTDEINKSILGGTAKEVKVQRGLTKSTALRDNLSTLELAALNLAEVLADKQITETNAQGFKPCKTICTESANKVAQVLR